MPALFDAAMALAFCSYTCKALPLSVPAGPGPSSLHLSFRLCCLQIVFYFRLSFTLYVYLFQLRLSRGMTRCRPLPQLLLLLPPALSAFGSVLCYPCISSHFRLSRGQTSFPSTAAFTYAVSSALSVFGSLLCYL